MYILIDGVAPPKGERESHWALAARLIAVMFITLKTYYMQSLHYNSYYNQSCSNYSPNKPPLGLFSLTRSINV